APSRRRRADRFLRHDALSRLMIWPRVEPLSFRSGGAGRNQMKARKLRSLQQWRVPAWLSNRFRHLTGQLRLSSEQQIRKPKFETRNKHKIQNPNIKTAALTRDLRIRALVIRICFGFRHSNFDLYFFSEYSARTVSAIPPRAENCAVMIASRGAHALTKSS